METREFLMGIIGSETTIVQFDGKELVVDRVQSSDLPGRHYVVVPGFKVGGPHAPTEFESHLQVLDVIPVGRLAGTEPVREFLLAQGFEEPINFW